MAFSYFVKPNSADSHQADPYWLGVVVPFKYKDTYDRSAGFSSNGQSKSEVISDKATVIAELPFVFLDNDCISWETSSSKQSHVSNLSLQLLHTNTNYTTAVTPEDWIFFWAFNNYADYLRTKNLVKARSRANHFENAPKFIGRIETVFLSKTVQANGTVSRGYSLTAVGFSELDSNMFFNSIIQVLNPQALDFLPNFANAEVKQLATGGTVDAQIFIPFLLKVCLGLGPGTNVSNQNSTNSGGSVISPNKAYLIPSGAVQLLIGSGPKR